MLALDKLDITQGGFRLSAHLTIAPNQTTAILGPSGGGKSTLLMALAGFTPHRGTVTWCDREISGLDPSARPISLLFQDHNLFPHLSIAANVGLGLRPNLKLSAAEKHRVCAALARVGLEDKMSCLPQMLSGGQRQRAALARALLRQKPIWLLDEPFAALGPGLRREMLNLVEEIRAEQQATLLLVTHTPEDARHVAAACAFVQDGRVSAPIGTGAFFAAPSTALKAYLG